jgi:uncharacterized membrane protein
MTKDVRNEWLLILLLVLLVVFSILLVDDFMKNQEVKTGEEDSYQKAVKGNVVRVIDHKEVESQHSTLDTEYAWETQVLEILVLEGPHKGERLKAENIIDERLAHSIEIKENDRVLVYIEEDQRGKAIAVNVAGYSREIYLYLLIGSFALLLILVGAVKGIKSIITLSLTVGIIVKILLPLILSGQSPLLVSILCCVVIIAITLVIIGGVNKKTFSAIVGTTGGVFFAGLIAYLMGTLTKLSGLGDDEAQMLVYIPQDISLDFRGLLFAAILIGTLGAVMDVGMSIASAMNEIEDKKPEITSRELIKSGMNIGRDIMGTMSNTLILAYTGSSLHLMLLMMAYNIPFLEIINQDMIATEVVRAIAGSMGLILSIPLTALVAATVGRKW